MTARMARRFQVEKMVSLTGMISPPKDSARKESGVAAVSGPEPEYPMCQTMIPE